MIEQGYDMDPSLLYQDNMSAILLETNGRASSSKQTKHIKVKYFLIKDKVDREEITIENCPIEQIRMDINTKPSRKLSFGLSGDMSWASPLITTMQASRPGIISDHQIGYLNKFRCYPYQGIV
jgi:hypothetical protein